jgi:hypothetical protein
MSASLASIEQLSAYLGQPLESNDASGLLMLQIASGMVRDYLHQQLDYVAGDVVTLDPIYGSYVLLPELPVVSVAQVETWDGTQWNVMDASTYTVSRKTGMIAGKPGLGITWPSDPETWRITYSHGYATIPDGIMGVVCGVAARAYSSPASVTMESMGGYRVQYHMHADGFSPLEKAALENYATARVA